MKRIAIVLSLCLMASVIPMNVFADTASGTATSSTAGSAASTSTTSLTDPRLPTLSLPQLPALQQPTLSNDFNQMVSDLKSEGFGQYKYGQNSQLPLPTVEAPAGSGTSAFDKFKETYGDIWNDPTKQLDKTSTIPATELFNALDDFAKQNQTAFDTVKASDKATMASLLQQKLDTSSMWNLDAIKSQVKFLTPAEQQAVLNNAAKPAGWDAIENSIPTAPDKSSWLNVLNPSGGGDVLNSMNLMDGMKGNIFGSPNNYFQSVNQASDEKNAYLDQINKQMATGTPLTDEQKQKIKDLTTNEEKARAQIVTNAVNTVSKTVNNVEGWFESKDYDNLRNQWVSIQDAEQKYGKGNAQVTWGGNYVAKDSVQGKLLNIGNLGDQYPYTTVTNAATGKDETWGYRDDANGNLVPYMKGYIDPNTNKYVTTNLNYGDVMTKEADGSLKTSK